MKLPLFVAIGCYLLVNVVTNTTSWNSDRTAAAFPNDLPKPAAVAMQEDEQDAVNPDRELFVGWENPVAVLLISGRQDGYIEPCGCTGLTNQKGGMLRREVLVRQLVEDRGWPLVSIDTGNQIRRTGPQPTIKLKTTYRGLFTALNYSAVSIGTSDLKTPSGDMIFMIENLKEEMQSEQNDKFVVANVTLYDYFIPYKVLTVNGRRIGVTAVLGDEEISGIANQIDSDYEITPVEEALAAVVPEMQKEQCDVYMLITNTSLEESRALAAKHPEFDFVIAGCGVGEPTREPELIPAGNRTVSLVQVGSKGMHVCAIGFFENDGKLNSRYQRIPMDARFEIDERMPGMKRLFVEYQDELARMTWDDLQISPRKHLRDDREFVGSAVCEDCHKYEYRVWMEGHIRDDNPDRVGPHYRATIDLLENPNNERTWVTREHDPECLSCHVTGWNPQGFYPYISGFNSIDDEDLHFNGCENCHGPASKHVEAEEDDIDDTELRQQYIDELIVTLEEAKKNLCVECHDLDNSPDFGPETFDEYWEKIDHNKDRRKPLD